MGLHVIAASAAVITAPVAVPAVVGVFLFMLLYYNSKLVAVKSKMIETSIFLAFTLNSLGGILINETRQRRRKSALASN
jgi:hypothetical protein